MLPPWQLGQPGGLWLGVEGEELQVFPLRTHERFVGFGRPGSSLRLRVCLLNRAGSFSLFVDDGSEIPLRGFSFLEPTIETLHGKRGTVGLGGFGREFPVSWIGQEGSGACHTRWGREGEFREYDVFESSRRERRCNRNF